MLVPNVRDEPSLVYTYPSSVEPEYRLAERYESHTPTKLSAGMKANRTSTTARNVEPPGFTTARRQGLSGARQNRIKSKATIATFHGQITEFQSCPQGPRLNRIKACIKIAATTAGFRRGRTSSPRPIAASVTGMA